MADLDDFFAKKDKKKKGSKKKGFSMGNTEVLAKTLEENERKEQRAEEKAAPMLATSEAARAQGPILDEGQEDEWKAFEEEKKDYSNLKIDTLKIDETPEKEEEHEINEEGEKVPRKAGGPWNLSASNAAAVAAAAEEAERQAEAKRKLPDPTENLVVGGTYVPPALRGAGERASGPPPPRSGQGRRPKAAPSMDSQLHFPSLSAASAGSDAHSAQTRDSSTDFEEVRSGGSANARQMDAGKQKLNLDNKFSALRGSN